MDNVIANQLRNNPKTYIEQIVNTHSSLKATRKAGEFFIVSSVDDYEKKQELLTLVKTIA